jgi:hypothetical protein
MEFIYVHVHLDLEFWIDLIRICSSFIAHDVQRFSFRHASIWLKIPVGLCSFV